MERKLVKVTIEKLPKSLIALEIELDADQVEKGLDRAARKLSQKYVVPGFRKGKAPRFIIENYFGRPALMEEASEDLINKAFQAALNQEGLNPVGPAAMEGSLATDPFRFRVTIPVPPTVTLPAYRSYRIPLEIDAITDDVVDQALATVREKHVVLKELEEPRPARHGDQLTAKLQSFVNDEPLNATDANGEIPDTTLILDPRQIVEELYNGLLGINLDESREIEAQMPDDHANDHVRGKLVIFKIHVSQIQERLLPAWDEIPVLEEYAGTMDAFIEKTRQELETTASNQAESKVIDEFIEQLLTEADFDIPDVIIHEDAHHLLHEQGSQYERYGITLEQMLQYRGKTHEEAVEELVPQAEKRVKTTLALQQIVQNEELTITEEEIEQEFNRILEGYAEEERPNIAQVLTNQLRSNIANVVIDRKLRKLIVAMATGNAPATTAETQTDAELVAPVEASAEAQS